MLKKFKKIQVQSSNGETHYILKRRDNLEIFIEANDVEDLDEEEFKKLMKKEASKRLYLLRDE